MYFESVALLSLESLMCDELSTLKKGANAKVAGIVTNQSQLRGHKSSRKQVKNTLEYVTSVIFLLLGRDSSFHLGGKNDTDRP